MSRSPSCSYLSAALLENVPVAALFRFSGALRFRRCGLRRHLQFDLEGLQHGGRSFLDALARCLAPSDGLVATTGPGCDVPEGLVARVESECLEDHVGRGLCFQLGKRSVVVLLVEQCVADFVRQRLDPLCG